jgi:hypothetical protein
LLGETNSPTTPPRPRVCSGAATGAHHDGDQETILYVVEGIARYRWGEHLEHVVAGRDESRAEVSVFF